jgi:hypothetical protein
MRLSRAARIKKLWQELSKSVSRKPNPLSGMTKNQAIERLRKTRQKLWEEKFAARP